MAAGLHWFLKYACRSSVSWDVTGGHNIDSSCFTPAFLRELEQQGSMHRARSVPWHYYQNVVTPRSGTPHTPWPAFYPRRALPAPTCVSPPQVKAQTGRCWSLCPR